MSRTQSLTHAISEEEKRKDIERQRLRHKVIFQWGIPITIGVFSFLYWLVLVPLIFPILPTHNWAIVGPVAFFIWLLIIIPFLWLWRYKQKSLIALPPPLKDQCEYPLFPTKVATIQPITEAKHSPCSRSQDGSVWIPVQPGNVTPSLYNSQTGRDSFQSDYRLDDVPEKPIDESKTITRNNSGIQLVKKLDSENQTASNYRLISVSSSSSSDTSGLDFKKLQRDPGDGLDARENENENICELQELDSSGSHTQAIIESQKRHLERDESFKGLPELQNFDEYLHLVTLDTPMSPRDVFFSDMTQSEPKKNDTEIQMRQQTSYHPGGDLSEVQRRIAEARKSLPPLFHYPDIEMGEPRVLKTTTLPPQSVLKVEDEKQFRHPRLFVRSLSEGGKRSWAARPPKTSGEFFIADVARLDSITSEVQMSVQPDVSQSCLISRWETKLSSIAVSPSSVETSPQSSEPAEGRWVILSKDYASNYLEAFIRIEQEAMNRERNAPRLASEEADNDSVFLELDQ